MIYCPACGTGDPKKKKRESSDFPDVRYAIISASALGDPEWCDSCGDCGFARMYPGQANRHVYRVSRTNEVHLHLGRNPFIAILGQSYEIPLSRLRCGSQVVDFVFQIQQKMWCTPTMLRDFVRAIELACTLLFESSSAQGRLCPFGRNTVTTWPEKVFVRQKP